MFCLRQVGANDEEVIVLFYVAFNFLHMLYRLRFVGFRLLYLRISISLISWRIWRWAQDNRMMVNWPQSKDIFDLLASQTSRIELILENASAGQRITV